MKRLIVALIGETGSGKSTFASMCTDEDIHPIVAGTIGKKGTTKAIIEMTFKKGYPDFNKDEFNKHFEQEVKKKEKRIKIVLPLGNGIELSAFDAMTILDTQGLNDWKTDDEKEAVQGSIIDVCHEADIIFVTIPDGGSVVSTNVILETLFEQYGHKPIVFIYNSKQSRVKRLIREKCINEFKKDVEVNIGRYKEIYPGLSDIIAETDLPDEIGISPLFCVLPYSDELSSDIDLDAEEYDCDNVALKEYIGSILQYAIILQDSLISKMRDDYLAENLEDISKNVHEMQKYAFIANHFTQFMGYPLWRPYVRDYNNYPQYDIEHTWQGGTPYRYPVSGGDYTYAANDIYRNIEQMIHCLKCTPSVKSSLLSVLRSFSEDRNTPGTLNLNNGSYMRGIPIKWLIDIRTQFYMKRPERFNKALMGDFDCKQSYRFMNKMDAHFKSAHPDWDKCLSTDITFVQSIQGIIAQRFGNRQGEAAAIIYATRGVITTHIDFCKNISQKFTDVFDKESFDSEGRCIVFE